MPARYLLLILEAIRAILRAHYFRIGARTLSSPQDFCGSSSEMTAYTIDAVIFIRYPTLETQF